MQCPVADSKDDGHPFGGPANDPTSDPDTDDGDFHDDDEEEQPQFTEPLCEYPLGFHGNKSLPFATSITSRFQPMPQVFRPIQPSGVTRSMTPLRASEVINRLCTTTGPNSGDITVSSDPKFRLPYRKTPTRSDLGCGASTSQPHQTRWARLHPPQSWKPEEPSGDSIKGATMLPDLELSQPAIQ